jgi:NAD(P)-dependent dehydrogenase (short-subunit alcohol dehydrogenase family)
MKLNGRVYLNMDTKNVNGVGLLRICKAVFGLIGKGTVIANITSEAGSITNCYRSAEYMYSISKAAANMASKILSNEVYPLGARVICFHPGWLRTQMGGIDAKTSERGVEPADSAEQIIDKVINIDKIPASWIFMEQTGALLPW